MKVTIVALKYNQDGGGANRSLELLVKNLFDDFEINLITLRDDLTHYSDFEVPIQEYSSSSSADVFQNCLTVLRNNESKTDLYHIFTPDLIPIGGYYRKTGGNIPILGRLNTYGIFCTNYSKMDGRCHSNCHLLNKIRHDDTPHRYRNLPRYLYKTISPRLCNYVDCLIAISPAVERIHREAGINNRMEVIPNCYDPHVESSPINHGDSLLYVGRLTEEKGVEYLIRAFHNVHDDLDHSLRIVGDGDDKERLVRITHDYSITDRVTFTGWIPYEDLTSEYHAASVFIHPGTWPEPFGRTILEAMQHKTPLVVTDIGAPPWIAGDGAISVQPRDIDPLANGIREALSEPTKNLLIRNGQANLERYSPERTYNKIAQLYWEHSNS